jgi:RimJ/RimL family protein N-acetyltransferase
MSGQNLAAGGDVIPHWGNMTDAAAYPSELDSQVRLADGRRLHIRALRPCEGKPIRDLYARLSPRTRYNRFFSPMPALPDSIVRLLSCIDYRNGVALVAEDERSGQPSAVALGSFGAIDDVSAEIAIVVQDGWQRQGLGSALVAKLLQAAEDRGFHRFVVSILAENTVIRNVLARFGRVIASTTRSGVAEIVFVRRTPATSAAPGSAR